MNARMNVAVYIESSRQLIGWARYYTRSTKRKEIDRMAGELYW